MAGPVAEKQRNSEYLSLETLVNFAETLDQIRDLPEIDLRQSQEQSEITTNSPGVLIDETKLQKPDRALTEVNHLIKNRNSDGSYSNDVLDDVLTNLKTAVKEASISFSISRVESEVENTRQGRITKWMGQTAVDSARSGYKFHFSEAATRRVDLEVDEAKYFENNLEPGVIKMFISPRMSAADAPKTVAEAEHLADDDSIRCDWLEINVDGSMTHVKESILVRDIPLQAWVDMLADPQNIFGRAIVVNDPTSAESIMRVHRELELPLSGPIKSPVDLAREATGYIRDAKLKREVEAQLELFNADQEKLDKIAESTALEWLRFECLLVESHLKGQLESELVEFIEKLDDQWSPKARKVLKSHMSWNGYQMSKEIALVLENAKRKTLWSKSGMEAGDKRVVNQLDHDSYVEYQKIKQAIEATPIDSYEREMAQATLDKFFAKKNLKISGGCSGGIINMFDEEGNLVTPDNVFKQDETGEDKYGSLKFNCPSCKKTNTRARGQLLENCRHCTKSVRCG